MSLSNLSLFADGGRSPVHKTKQSPLLARFTPSLMGAEALESIFVKRNNIADRIVELAQDSAKSGTRHQTLIVGPRGSGKTHLLSIIYHRLFDHAAPGKRLNIVWLREEEWGITSLLDFLIRTIKTLADTYKLAELDALASSLFDHDAATAERMASNALAEFIAERNILLLVENLDDLFAGLGDYGQKKLRSFLQENPRIMIVATSQSLFGGVSLHSSPFYGFFRTYHLDDFTFDDAYLLLTKVASFEGNTMLIDFLATPQGRARARAIHHLAGGSPRVYMIFAQFMTRDSLDDLVEPFIETLDDLTPYYHERMRWLSPQQRKIVELLTERRSAISVKEIAQHCFITHQTTSSQLRNLREMGYVRSIGIGRGVYYELREPLMRMCLELKKAHGQPVRFFAEFLRLWYSSSEIESKLARGSGCGHIERQYLQDAMSFQHPGAMTDPRISDCNNDRRKALDNGDYDKALTITEELLLISDSNDDRIEKAHILGHIGRFEEALIAIKDCIDRNPGVAEAWNVRAWALLNLGRPAQALEAIDEAIKIAPTLAANWHYRAGALVGESRYDEALAAYDKVKEINPKDPELFLGRARVYSLMGKAEDAIKLLLNFESANRASPFTRQSLRLRAQIYGTQEKWGEALTALQSSKENGEPASSVCYSIAFALYNLNRFQDALAALDEGISAGDNTLCTKFGRVETLFALNRRSEAAASLRAALNEKAEREHFTEHTIELLRDILRLGNQTYSEIIAIILEIYESNEKIDDLALSLGRVSPVYLDERVPIARLEEWFAAWTNLATQNRFDISKRFMDVLVRYRNSKSHKVFLDLPTEERALLLEALPKNIRDDIRDGLSSTGSLEVGR